MLYVFVCQKSFPDSLSAAKIATNFETSKKRRRFLTLQIPRAAAADRAARGNAI